MQKCKLRGEKRKKRKEVYPQNTLTGKQRFNFSASINQNCFPGMNRVLAVNPIVEKKD